MNAVPSQTPVLPFSAREGVEPAGGPNVGASGSLAGTERASEPLAATTQRRLRAVAVYVGAVAACLLILTLVLQLWHADLSVPFLYGGDSLLFQALAKGAVEQGWYLHNARVGAPFGLELHDFPLVDSLHFLGIKLLALKGQDYARGYNLYFLLTFPLTTLTSLYVLRRFHVSYGPAVVGSLLFTLLPYHFLRGEGHLFLASYYLIPLIVRVVVQIGLGRTPFLRPDPDTGKLRWTWRDGRSVAAVVVCLLVACGGVYYAFFSCYFLLAAGAAACAKKGTGPLPSRGPVPFFARFFARWYPLAAAGVTIAVISLGVLANLAPTLLYRWQHGDNPVAVLRVPYQAEEYGLKVCQLLFPMRGHRLAPLRDFEARYSGPSTPLVNENHMAALGLIGALGFLFLAARLLRVPCFRGQSPVFTRGPLMDVLAVLVIAAVLLATIGGFGSVFSYLVSGWIRAYNRISVFIAFFSLFAVVLLLDTAVRKYGRSARARMLMYGLLGLVLLLGVLDQTSPAFVPAYDSGRKEYQLDAAYVQTIEATVPAHTMIFQLPHLGFPESFPVHAMQDYDPLRGFLHSRTLRWSYGALKGREGDLWLQQMADRPVDDLVETLACAGFGGISVDCNGYADRGADLLGRLIRLVGAPTAVRADNRFVFFNLGPYAERRRAACTESEWREREEEALHPLLFGWLGGFYGNEGTNVYPVRWCAAAGELRVFNRASRTRTVRLEMSFRSCDPQPAEVRLDGPLFSERVAVSSRPTAFARAVAVPPGVYVIRFRCDGRRLDLRQDPRVLVFRVEGFRATRIE